MEYRFYFPPDLDRSFFLAGRRPSFAGWYSVGFYTHIISGPFAIVLVVTLLVTGNSKRFKQLHRWSGRLLALVTVGALGDTHKPGAGHPQTGSYLAQFEAVFFGTFFASSANRC